MKFHERNGQYTGEISIQIGVGTGGTREAARDAVKNINASFISSPPTNPVQSRVLFTALPNSLQLSSLMHHRGEFCVTYSILIWFELLITC